MAGKTYTFKEFYPDLKRGLQETIALYKKLEKVGRKVQSATNTGKGLKNLTQAQRELKELNKKLLAQQKQKVTLEKRMFRATQKRITQENKIKNSLNLKLQTEKQLLRLQQQQITAQAKANAQKKLGIRATKGLVGSINQLISRMGALLLVYVGFNALRESVELFKVQEQAVKDNITVFGEFSRVLQQHASDVQKDTTVGDERFIALSTQAKNFGIANDKVIEATEGVIGLSEKFKMAGLGQETALKGIANAYEGNFSQLERYIPALRSAETESEKMAILQEEMAAGFDLAKEAAKSQTGQLEQMKNEMGDTKEEIGEVLIPALLSLYKTALQVVKGFKAIREYMKFGTIISAQDEEAIKRRINKFREEIQYVDESIKKRRIVYFMTKVQNDLDKAIDERKSLAGKIANNENRQLGKTLDNRIKVLRRELLLVKELANDYEFLGNKAEYLTGGEFGDGDDDPIKKVEELAGAFEQIEQGSRGAEKAVDDFTETIAKMAKSFDDVSRGEGAETTKPDLIDRIFGSKEKYAETVNEYQKLYSQLSTITGNFYDFLDNRKDQSLRKDKRRRVIAKGLDITNATIRALFAIVDTIAETKGGAFAKIAAGALVGAVGFSNVAKIASTKYNKGTEYVNRGIYPAGTDTIPVLTPDGIGAINEGERIVDTPTNRELDGFPNPLLPKAVNFFKQNYGNTNIERLLKEQNRIISNKRELVSYGNWLYVAVNGHLTGEKYKKHVYA